MAATQTLVEDMGPSLMGTPSKKDRRAYFRNRYREKRETILAKRKEARLAGTETKGVTWAVRKQKYQELAKLTGLRWGKVKAIRTMLREQARRTGEDLMTLYEANNVMTLNERKMKEKRNVRSRPSAALRGRGQPLRSDQSD